MKKALIIYHSKTGITKQFAKEIGTFCAEKGNSAKVISIEEYSQSFLSGIDHLFLGCWTSGLFLFAQHPDKSWKKFAKTLQIPDNCKIILFTTYKLATGSMFTNMKKYLICDKHKFVLNIKSRNGKLIQPNTDLLRKAIESD